MTPINPTGGEIRPWLQGTAEDWFKTLNPPLCCRDCEQAAIIHARELFEEQRQQLSALQAENERLKKDLEKEWAERDPAILRDAKRIAQLESENARLREELSKTALLIINQALSAGENKGKE